MRAVLQRVTRASVEVDGPGGQIGHGWLVLLGVARGDIDDDADWLADKVLNLRAFADDQGKMNRSVLDVGRCPRRQPVHPPGRLPRRPPPSFIEAADPDEAERLYLGFVDLLAAGLDVATGVFRAMMKVSLVNDGPGHAVAG